MRQRIILSIDGGGIRGIIPLTFLSHLEAMVQEKIPGFSISTSIDLFAGTSTGALISGALMLQGDDGKPVFSPTTILNLYATRGKQIFSHAAETNDKIFPLKFILDSNFSAYPLSSIKKNYLFLSYDLSKNKKFIFKKSSPHSLDFNLSDAIMACCAIPNLFPPLVYKNTILVDGALCNKNTALLAYKEARKLFPNDKLVLLSLGTGNLPLHLIDSMERKMQETHQNLLKLTQRDKLLCYFRLQTDLIQASPALDDASTENIDKLKSDAIRFLQAHQQIVEKIASLFY